MKGFAFAALAILALAGCASTKDSSTTTGTPGAPEYQRYELPEDPNPDGAGHDHADPAQHKFLWNYDFASRDPLLQNAVNVAGVHALDVQAGYLFGAVYGSHTASVDGGLVIWDLKDPAHPVETGRWIIPGSVGGDRSMEATSDGNYAVISTEPFDCAGHVNPTGGVLAAYLIDTSDKSLPIVADVMLSDGTTLGNVVGGVGPGLAPELGQHSVAVHKIQGDDYAFVFGKIFKIDRTEQGARLLRVGEMATGHDIYVRDTPWNTTWALSANGGGALAVWDVTNPADAFQLGVWELPDRDAGPEYYFHTADSLFLDDQALVVLTSEDFADHVSPFWVLDANALAGKTEKPEEPIELTLLGSWHNPGNHNALDGLQFSLHNPRIHDGGILSISSYHGGMWQLDLRAPEFWSDPSPIAYAAYADGDATLVRDPVENAVAQNLCGLTINLDAPSYWDIEVGPNGVLYLADGFLGLYTFTPTADHPIYGDAKPGEFPGTAGL